MLSNNIENLNAFDILRKIYQNDLQDAFTTFCNAIRIYATLPAIDRESRKVVWFAILLIENKIIEELDLILIKNNWRFCGPQNKKSKFLNSFNPHIYFVYFELYFVILHIILFKKINIALISNEKIDARYSHLLQKLRKRLALHKKS